MRSQKKITVVFLFLSIGLLAQTNSIKINASLDDKNDLLNIQQDIVFYNHSIDTLQEIYLHNWSNSFKNNKTQLTHRFVEDHKKDLYFANKKNRGFSKIISLSLDFKTIKFTELKNQIDILKISLENKLLPKDSVHISITYQVKIPNAKYTGYGKTKSGYHLRFWYINPAVYQKKWHLMSNLNIDDLYENPTNYNIQIVTPKKYTVESNLYQYLETNAAENKHTLVGVKKVNIIISIDSIKKYKSFKTKNINIKTNVFLSEINTKLSTDILNRELLFIEKHLGKYPHKEIFIDKITQKKNPIYGLNQLPNFLSPFSDTFKWDITMFKALSKKYIENVLLLNKRTDYWILDGLQTYLMIEYVNKYYPEVKLLGKVSNIWGVRKFNISKLHFNDKYPFLYQFSARQFLDQSLITRADSLSNFNRKIINKYKAGLGLRYLKDFIGDTVLHKSFREFYLKYKLKLATNKEFKKIIIKNTNKDLQWFFGDYLSTNKKIDYTIKDAVLKEDSIQVTIKNKRNITAPVALYGVKNKKIVYKKWITNIDTTKTVTIKNNSFDRLSLNYQQSYPEYNSLDNWKDLKKGVLNKPIQFKFLKDIEDPYYNQIFYQPEINYNYYDGLIFSIKLHNRPIIPRNLEIRFAPAYAFKSKSVTGSFSTIYNNYLENSKLYKIKYGVFGTKLHYAPQLAYRALIPFVDFVFNRPSLREASNSFLTAKVVSIDKDVVPNTTKTEEDQYSVFSLKYVYNKADIIKETNYILGAEIAKNFTKLFVDFRFRRLTAKNRQLDFRVFVGTFLNNTTTDNYFSFGLDRVNDYLFELNYFGRSENTGIFSQQFILAEGGFKSVLPIRFANQFMFSTNSSIGLWRWVEAYNSVAFLKNKNQPLFFGYENGVRLNFVNNIFEIYFPFYSNNGWEISQNSYPQKIRFVFTSNIHAIYNFFRRGFL